MSTKNAPKVTATRAPTEIPDAGAGNLDPDELEGLVIGPPFAMTADCELHDRGGEACPECGQPEVSGCVAIVECECGQVFRVNLLAEGMKQCPGRCGRTFTHILLITTQDEDQTFADAAVQVLRANGYTVRAPGDDEQGDPDDDDEGDELEGDDAPDQADDDTDPETPATK